MRYTLTVDIEVSEDNLDTVESIENYIFDMPTDIGFVACYDVVKLEDTDEVSY